MSEHLPSQPSVLRIESLEFDRMEHGLGPNGPGVVRLPKVLNTGFHQDLLLEIADTEKVPWLDVGGTYVNQRGLEIVQNHDVFALKLSAGEEAPIQGVPLMKQLAEQTENFVQSLASRYPTLGTWQTDEMSYHRYYDEDIGLSYHRDNMRFPGLIVVIAIDGEADFQVIDRSPIYDKEGSIVDWDWRSTYTIPTEPGDMLLTRAPGLFSGMLPDDRPEHAVVHVRTLPRISFMLRANSKPEDTSYDFQYYNWPTAPSNE